MLRTLLTLVACVLRSTVALVRSREEQAIVELVLRQQLAVYVHGHPRPRLSPLVIRWHRKAFRGYWRWISKPGPGRPPISEETKSLITRMATENGWRARKIRAELAKLGVLLGLRAISGYLPKVDPGSDPQQRWMIFLRNHRDLIAGMDFFVVPRVHFRRFYVWFAIDHGRRRVLHFKVTESPTASWVIQQLRHAFPNEPTHRYLILDNDAIFSDDVTRPIAAFGIDPKRTAFRSPRQNGTAGRFVGTVRRGLVDHVVVLDEQHLRRLLREYVEYCNRERVHSSLADAPRGRVSETRPASPAMVTGLQRVGGLHHRYSWRHAA